ncbi:energy-coupling factor transporter ATPase [Serratia sp. 1D1416]|uniref:energy-coupling factor transporter ATPase n=1 Tax=Serratia sp. 1D1416 TaxID=2447890 RepID=UPI0013EA3AE2|nr:energy-coupling factor transporter ATPase [Serratia sp. 1D1416]
MPILELRNISHIYNQGTPFEKQALQGLNLTIETGDFIGVIGQTGSGKSTLLRMLNGLLRPTTGTVAYCGQNIWMKRFNLQQLRFDVGVSFQYPEHQLFCDTVREELAYGLNNQRVPPVEQTERISATMAMLDLDESYLKRSPFLLSGGEMRRVALASTMALHPKVLVLDEPTAGLDPKSRERIYSSLKNYQKEHNSSIVIVSHSMDDVAEYAQKLVVLHQGRLWLEGPIYEIFAQAERLTEVGLALPAITQLMRKIQQAGLQVPTDVYDFKTAQAALFALVKKEG